MPHAAHERAFAGRRRADPPIRPRALRHPEAASCVRLAAIRLAWPRAARQHFRTSNYAVARTTSMKPSSSSGERRSRGSTRNAASYGSGRATGLDPVKNTVQPSLSSAYKRRFRTVMSLAPGHRLGAVSGPRSASGLHGQLMVVDVKTEPLSAPVSRVCCSKDLILRRASALAIRCVSRWEAFCDDPKADQSSR